MTYVRDRQEHEYRECGGMDVVVEFEGEELRTNQVLVLGTEITYNKDEEENDKE